MNETLDIDIVSRHQRCRPAGEVAIEVELCVPDDQVHFAPTRRRHPKYLPASAPVPRMGEVVYLSSSSAWTVIMVVHEWRSPVDLRIEVWLEHIGHARVRRPDFAVTQ